MSFLRRKPAEAAVSAPVEPSAPAVGKGRPTPKRSEAQGRRGPVAPPPMTQREAVKRAKTATPTGKPLTKDERRAQSVERREKMMRGDDKYVLPRDRGAIRAYVRDLVDTRRNVAGILLPVALLSFFILLVPNVPVLQVYGPLLLLVAILAGVVDSAIFGRQITRKVAAKFPKGDGSGSRRRRRLELLCVQPGLPAAPVAGPPPAVAAQRGPFLIGAVVNDASAEKATQPPDPRTREIDVLLARFFDSSGRLAQMPAKQARRIAVLDLIAGKFIPGVKYTEPEVNRELMAVFDDYVSLRRALVDYGFLDRADGRYWRSGGTVEV